MAFSDVLFDLDGTLYAESSGLLPAIGGRIVEYVEQRLKLGRPAALELCDDLYRRHGLTICGLRIEHGVDADEYLDFVHDVDYRAFLAADPALGRRLAAIPLRKSVFTNAPLGHAARVLEELGIGDQFAAIFDLHWSDWAPKPVKATYQRVLAELGAEGPKTIMVEDTAHNLPPAQELGMTTIWIGGGPAPQGADYVGRNIDEVLEIVADLAPTTPRP